MKDIAQSLGVSVITVSKVLRNASDISTETRKRVLRRVKELNYQPNLAARALVTGRTNLIGLIVPDLLHPFFAQVAKAISVRLRSLEYGLVIASSEDDPDLEEREIGQMLAHRVDALIVASTQPDGGNLRRIEECNVRCVLLDRKVRGLSASFVGIDDVMAGSLATNHLVEVGCRTIAHLAGRAVSTAVDRQAGYVKALAKHGLSLSPHYIVECESGDDSGDASGYTGMHQLLKLTPRPDGVFCWNDPIAMGAMRAVLEAGLRIPQDVAIVGCGNLHFDDVLRIPLTSVDQDSEGLGLNAAKFATSLIKRKSGGPPKSLLMPVRLVIRASSKR